MPPFTVFFVIKLHFAQILIMLRMSKATFFFQAEKYNSMIFVQDVLIKNRFYESEFLCNTHA